MAVMAVMAGSGRSSEMADVAATDDGAWSKLSVLCNP